MVTSKSNVMYVVKDWYHTVYTIQPLYDKGVAALDCSKIKGIDYVKLIEVFYMSSPTKKTRLLSKDLFTSSSFMAKPFPPIEDIISVRFAVKITRLKELQEFDIKLPDFVNYPKFNNCYSLIKKWLLHQKFAIPQVLELPWEGDEAWFI